MLQIHKALIDLSNIFKQGFTVTYEAGFLNQYSNTKRPFIVSYKPLITINSNFPVMINIKHNIPDKCLIGGWHDKETNLYHIELNKAFKNKEKALLFAIKHNQQYIYDMNNQKVIEVC